MPAKSSFARKTYLMFDKTCILANRKFIVMGQIIRFPLSLTQMMGFDLHCTRLFSQSSAQVWVLTDALSYRWYTHQIDLLHP